jgi:hypothetical protein
MIPAIKNELGDMMRWGDLRQGEQLTASRLL